MKKKRIFGLLAIILILIGFFLVFQLINMVLPKGKGALQVTSNIKAKVLLNGKVIGTTPLCRCETDETIDTGLYTLQLIPEGNSQSYTAKIKIINGVLTAVDRTFLPGSYASSYTLYLEKIRGNDPELFVSSVPDGSLVSLDGNDIGVTPNTVKQISASEHEIELQKSGYGKKTIRVRTVSGYRLIVEAILGTVPSGQENLPGQDTPPNPTPTEEKVTILTTPVGFLRVRNGPGVNFLEVDQIKPGEEFKLLTETDGWYKILLSEGKEGWIASDYAEKN